ncbi:MAG: BsuPI-related putative proteinase inhibitor [Gemmatimonadota bacterium]
MSSRFLIPVLCVGAVAYACGPRTRSDASGSRKAGTAVAQSTTKPVLARSVSRKNGQEKPSLVARLTVNADPSAVRLALHVVNAGSRRVEVNFPTGQTYDFVILDSIGREVWRWGSGRMFTQTLRNKLLDGGEGLDVAETWQTDALAPGRYMARATLKSDNFPLTQQTEFTVSAATTVAAREEPQN